jgi:hypothetical protein
MTGVSVGLDVGVTVSKGVEVAETMGALPTDGLAEGMRVALAVGVCRTSGVGVAKGGRDL